MVDRLKKHNGAEFTGQETFCGQYEVTGILTGNMRGFEEMEMEVEEPQKEMEEVFGERYLLYLNLKD